MNLSPIKSSFVTSASAVRASPAAESVRERQSAITERAAAHFENHKEKWTEKKYGELLKKDAPRPALQPFGHVQDRSARLMRAAEHLVARKQANRLNRINAAADRLARGVDQGVGR